MPETAQWSAMALIHATNDDGPDGAKIMHHRDKDAVRAPTSVSHERPGIGGTRASLGG
jgi:hypothetical protein